VCTIDFSFFEIFFLRGMNRHRLGEAMVETSKGLDTRVDDLIEGQYITMALDSWTDVTKVKMVNLLGIVKCTFSMNACDRFALLCGVSGMQDF